jgi:imidazolonepropionase
MQDVGLIADGAIAISDGEIIAVGTSAELRERYMAALTLDAHGKVVCPGFVDPHTHVVYAGDRVNEFELRIKGATYMEIMAAGGGIANTTRATRAASLAELVLETSARLDAMLRLGTTTAEAKTGYGLDTETELKMLRAIEELDQAHPMELVPTFLGAHAIPPEYKGRTDDYVDLIVREMLPAVVAWYRESHFANPEASILSLSKDAVVEGRILRQAQDAYPVLFCDVFCEQNAFDVAQSRRVLEAARALGMGIKAHVDEFTSLGGVPMALELGATSIDHLDVTTAEDSARLAQSNTIGVVIPTVNFNLGSTHFANARALIDAGVALALTTDINPGSAPCPSLPLVMAIACRYQHVLPSEALNACTINAAYAIGLGEQVGSLEVGKQADLLIVNAPDYRHLAYQFGVNLVEQVIKRGQII